MKKSVVALLICAIAGADGAYAASDEIFGNGFEPVGFVIPLASPLGPDFEYTAQVTIGDQDFALQIDTGSTTLGVAGAGCSSCTGVSPLYSPSASAMATGEKGVATYEDGSGWSGPIYSDTVGLGNGSPSVSVDLVDITTQKSFFDGDNDYQGILGLGPPGNAIQGTTGYIPELVSAGIENTFAFELCDNTGADAGTMWIGGDGAPVSVQLTPLVPITNNNPFYAINVNALSLGTTTVVTNAANTFEQPVLDTGTSLFYVPTSVFKTFRSDLQASAGFQAVFGSKTFPTSGANAGCVIDASVTDAEVQSGLPHLLLSLPNMTSGQPDVTIEASALDTYIYNGGDGSYCLAIQDGGTQDPSTFGDAFMQAFHIVINVADSRVGFAAPTNCVAPAISHRVLHPMQNGPHRPPRLSRPE